DFASRHRRDRFNIAGEFGLERKPRVTQHRRFPHHGELARLFFAQFAVSGTNFVSEVWITPKKDQQETERTKDLSVHHSPEPLTPAIGSSREPINGFRFSSTTMSYFFSRLAKYFSLSLR